MREDRLPAAFLVDDQPEADIKFLDTCHIRAGNRIVAEKNDSGINVRERDVILFAVLREQDPDPVVEVELDSLHRIQHGHRRHFPVNTRLLRGYLLLRRIGRGCSFRHRGPGAYRDIIEIQSRSNAEINHG